jgi:Arc/MetJ-type ribon-helix-helix transcriptional regulator
MRILSVRLDERTDALLRRLCARTGLSQSEVVKAGIAALAEQSPASPARLAEALDLVGCFDSGVGDLGREHSRRVRDKLARRRK